MPKRFRKPTEGRPRRGAGAQTTLRARSRRSTAGASLASHPLSRVKFALVKAACEASEFAVAPFSGFKVGAALLTSSGETVRGANVESASYGLTCCAERVALFKALSDGRRRFAAIAIAARHPGGAMPCGACRQLLAEYAPTAVVWVADSRRPRRIREYRVPDLLPEHFGGAKNLIEKVRGGTNVAAQRMDCR